jgi:hypothetical protein
MNSRHAAAVAFVGWYLMLAPADYDPDLVHPPPALSRWYISESFDRADECERVRMATLKRYSGKERLTEELSQLCVASDDPRLKGN